MVLQHFIVCVCVCVTVFVCVCTSLLLGGGEESVCKTLGLLPVRWSLPSQRSQPCVGYLDVMHLHFMQHHTFYLWLSFTPSSVTCETRMPWDSCVSAAQYLSRPQLPPPSETEEQVVPPPPPSIGMPFPMNQVLWPWLWLECGLRLILTIFLERRLVF